VYQLAQVVIFKILIIGLVINALAPAHSAMESPQYVQAASLALTILSISIMERAIVNALQGLSQAALIVQFVIYLFLFARLVMLQQLIALHAPMENFFPNQAQEIVS
jgi:hypothetical protein